MTKLPPGKSNPAELRAHLRAPLPTEAIKPDPRHNGLSAINPAYIIERLNDCFGEGGWTERYTVMESHPGDPMIVVRCDFAVPKLKITRQAFGGNDNTDRGDAYKGACTDALTKAASKLGIAHQVYKGEYDLQVKQEAKSAKERDRTYEKRLAGQQKISKFQIKRFLEMVEKTGKTGAQVNTYFHKLRITTIADMMRNEFNDAIKWASRSDDLTETMELNVAVNRPKQPTPAPALPPQDEGPIQRTLPVVIYEKRS